jgi:hypothetical protein
MASKYDEYPARKTDFGSFRDSFYILTVMNQYSMKRSASIQKEAEGLLRIALFSKDLKLKNTEKTLRQTRRILARELREGRKRGVVPVLASFGWFLFALAISIQSAFGYLGQNITAHDLALGCLVSWLPVLVGATIIDRNPIAADAIKKKLNALVDHVRSSLEDPEMRQEFINTFKNREPTERRKLEEWVDNIANHSVFMDSFFENYAGQGRVRWHYGAAHPIISDIENSYLADQGRWWLRDEEEARLRLVLGEVDEGLIWFDARELTQIASAFLVVTCTVFGAFALSFFTPTVGLGCRSGGYTIFYVFAFTLILFEMLVWWFVSPVKVKQPEWLRRATTATMGRWEDHQHGRMFRLQRRVSSFTTATETSLINLIRKFIRLFPWQDRDNIDSRVEEYLQNSFHRLHDLNAQKRWEFFFFRPLEIVNTCWLVSLYPSFFCDLRQYGSHEPLVLQSDHIDNFY